MRPPLFLWLLLFLLLWCFISVCIQASGTEPCVVMQVSQFSFFCCCCCFLKWNRKGRWLVLPCPFLFCGLVFKMAKLGQLTIVFCCCFLQRVKKGYIGRSFCLLNYPCFIFCPFVFPDLVLNMVKLSHLFFFFYGERGMGVAWSTSV